METQPTSRSLPPKITAEKKPETAKEKWTRMVSTVLVLIVSAFLISFSSYAIVAANDFVLGGVSGIAIILEKTLHISQSISVLCLNIPLLVVAFFFVRRRFAVYSVINVVVQSLWIVLFEAIDLPKLQFEEQIFAALAGGIGVGAGIGFAFKIGGSSGGMDIVATIVQRRFPAARSVAWMIFTLNSVVIVSSFFVFRDPSATFAVQLLPIIKSVTEQYVESRMNDSIISGFQSAIDFRVVTDKPEEVSDALISRLGHGVTCTEVTGMYTHEKHAMLTCVIQRRQIGTFKAILKEVDPNSFAVITHVSQVLGLGFKTSDN